LCHATAPWHVQRKITTIQIEPEDRFTNLCRCPGRLMTSRTPNYNRVPTSSDKFQNYVRISALFPIVRVFVAIGCRFSCSAKPLYTEHDHVILNAAKRVVASPAHDTVKTFYHTSQWHSLWTSTDRGVLKRSAIILSFLIASDLWCVFFAAIEWIASHLPQ
jgi:hypothetical protein